MFKNNIEKIICAFSFSIGIFWNASALANTGVNNEPVIKITSPKKPNIQNFDYDITCPKFKGNLKFYRAKDAEYKSERSLSFVFIESSINGVKFSPENILLANKAIDDIMGNIDIKGIQCRDEGFSLFIDTISGVEPSKDGYLLDTMFLYFKKDGSIEIERFGKL